MTARRVVVVGGGIAGLCAAYSLRKRGAEVTVVEGETVGSRVASSYGNGGWICPAQAGPLPEPGLTLTGMRALLNADSALYFRPSYLPRLTPWLLRFRRYCNRRDFERGMAALAALGRPSFELVDAMTADGVEFELYKKGMLCATATPADARKVLESLKPMRAFGYALPDDLLSSEELHALEPALSDKVGSGFHYSEQWHVRSNTLVEGLARRLREQGVEFREGSCVTGFDTAGETVRAVRTGEGEVAGDAFLLAAGSWTAQLARGLGVRFPLEPGKGYTFLIRPKTMPTYGILFADIHAGATPFTDRVRIGGTMEFSGFDLSIDRRRIDNVFRLAREYIELEDPEYEEPWAGLRPLTPDGLPVLDRAGLVRNAFVATGYSMLGMTLGAPAGEAMAEFVLGGERPAVLEPFRIDRFGRARRRAGTRYDGLPEPAPPG
jgi:D-amino-acid dehydrogenase